MVSLHRTSAALCLRAVPPRLQEAERHLQEAEAAVEGLDRPERSRLHLERALLALLQEQAGEALENARAARSLAGPEGMERARSELFAGRALAALGQVREARQAMEEAAARCRDLGAHREQAKCLRALGELALADGDREAAVQAFRSALGVLDPAEAPVP